MDEFRTTVASNLIRLRTASGITQAELGQKINYSDKSVSKWERAEALPDAYVLKQLADIYGVTVDYLLSPHNEIKPKSGDGTPPERSYSTNAITLVSIASIWTTALLAFVVLWIFGHIVWQVFVLAIPLSLITFLIFHSIWDGGKGNLYIVMSLVFSILLLIYVLSLQYNPWQIFILAVPAEIVVYASFQIKKKKKNEEESEQPV